MVVVGGGSYIVVGGRVVSLKSYTHMVKSSAEGSAHSVANFRIFRSFRFYVKSILKSLKVLNCRFCCFWCIILCSFGNFQP